MTVRSASPAALESRTFGRIRVIAVPSLVRGHRVAPPWPTVGDLRRLTEVIDGGLGLAVVGAAEGRAHLIGAPAIDPGTLAPTGEIDALVTPAHRPGDLLEPDAARARRELLDLDPGDVADAVGRVGAALAAGATGRVGGVDGAIGGGSEGGDGSDGDGGGSDGGGDDDGASPGGRWSSVGGRLARAQADQVAALFDGPAMQRLMEDQFGSALGQLAAWAEADPRPQPGVIARMAAADPGLSPAASAPGVPAGSGVPAHLRAVPTTQVHLAAGNSPVVLPTTLLWGWAARGACIVKPAAARLGDIGALGAAIAGELADHPLGRHTTLAYWPGSDPAMRPLIGPDLLERVVAWGSAETVAAVARERPPGDLIAMRPRDAFSVIGRDALGDVEGAAALAAADSVVANQGACMSSLLHLVEGGPAEADRYAAALVVALRRWDGALPHRPTPAVAGAMVQWRRGTFAADPWLIAGVWPEVTCAVVRADRPVDLRRQPGGRLVVVRAAPDLARALADLAGPDVSHVGVAPADLLAALRDELACRGVDTVHPLGDAERSYPGKPHDGLRVLHRLVRWVSA